MAEVDNISSDEIRDFCLMTRLILDLPILLRLWCSTCTK